MLFPEDSVLWVSPFVRPTSPTAVLWHPDYKRCCPSMHWLWNVSSGNSWSPQGRSSEQLSQHCPDTALEVLQIKEDIVSQLSPLLHSHVHFNPRDENWGILTLQPFASLLLRRRRRPFASEKDPVRKLTKNNALVQYSQVLQHYFHPKVNVPRELGIKLRMNII